MTNILNSRTEVRDFETVLKLLWIDVSSLSDEEKAEKAVNVLWATC